MGDREARGGRSVMGDWEEGEVGWVIERRGECDG